MCLSFLLAFACKVVRVPLLEGKCIASLQAYPAEDSLCLACFYCATTVQGLELDLRFCDGKLDCFYCWTASPYLPLDPFSSHERPRSSKKGAAATSVQTFTFFQALDPLLSRERPRSFKKGAAATSVQTFTFFQALDPLLSRERPRSFKKGAAATSVQTFTFFQALDPLLSRERPRSWGAATWHQTCCHLVLLSAFATHRGSTTVSSLGSCPLCLSACQGCFLLADPFPETLFGMTFAEHTFHARLA